MSITTTTSSSTSHPSLRHGLVGGAGLLDPQHRAAFGDELHTSGTRLEGLVDDVEKRAREIE